MGQMHRPQTSEVHLHLTLPLRMHIGEIHLVLDRSFLNASVIMRRHVHMLQIDRGITRIVRHRGLPRMHVCERETYW